MAAVAVASLARSAAAAEPYLPFLNALRDRGYFAEALAYLDTIETQQKAPADVLEQVPYERAQTLLRSAALLTEAEEQRRQLDLAEGQLERFVSQSPRHPYVGRAKADRAQLMFRRALVEIWEADDPANAAQEADLRRKAEAFLQQAQSAWTEARDVHLADYKQFPVSIPEEDVERRAARDDAKGRYIEAELDLARVQYWRAHALPPGALARTQAVEQAVAAFEAVERQFRDELAGAYAMLWKGKCFEELGDVRKALGVYDIILQYEDDQPAVVDLRDLALQFRLICLNHDQRKDYATAEAEAQEWLADHRERAGSEAGQGIQWERCRALEALSNGRELNDVQVRSLRRQALDAATTLSRRGGRFKGVAARMVQEMRVQLERSGDNLRTFGDAYAAASALADNVRKASEELRDAPPAQRSRRQDELRRMAADMAQQFDRALRLAEPTDEPDLVAVARLQLAFAYFAMGRRLECAAVAEQHMRTHADQQPELAREAGYLALSAIEAQHAAAGAADTAALRRLIQDWAERMISRWPDADRSHDARMIVARTFWSSGDAVSAADWWLQTPENAAQFADAQISAGQALWRQYAALARPAAGADSPPDAAVLRDLKQRAIAALERGIAEKEKSVPELVPAPEGLLLGKLTLAQIRNLDGIHRTTDGVTGALELLTARPHDVLSATAPSGERAEGPEGRLASFAYQQLLRAYIGLKDLDAARDARQKLERVAGGDDPQALTAVYVDFGRELLTELNQLAAAGDTRRYRETRDGLEEFLRDLAARQQGESFFSMLWVAETYASLAEGQGAADRTASFRQSAADLLQRIVARADEPGFLPRPEFRNVVQLRLAAARREQQQFSQAEGVLLPLLTANPMAPDVQFEVAHLYLAWAEQAPSDGGEERVRTALAGRRGPPEVWGWNKLVQRLQREVQTRSEDRLKALLVDARFHLAEGERLLAEFCDEPERTRHLGYARHAIVGFVRSTPGYTDSQHQRFNELYGRVLADLGMPVAPLPRDAAGLAQLPSIVLPADAAPTAPGVAGAPAQTADGASKNGAPAGRGGQIWLIGAVMAGAAAIAGGVMLHLSQSSRRRRRERLASMQGASAQVSRS